MSSNRDRIEYGDVPGAWPLDRKRIAVRGAPPPPVPGASAGPAPAPLDAGAVAERLAAAGIAIGPVRFGELRRIARIQREAFSPRLAYSYLTLLLLYVLPGARFLAARGPEGAVGCIIGDRHDGNAWVITIAVAREARRTGVGAGMLFALEGALTGGDMVLMVEQDNVGARTLYGRVGYREAGTAQHYYGRDRHGIWMRKRRVAGIGEPALPRR